MRHEIKCYTLEDLIAVIGNLKDMGIEWVEDDSNPEYVTIIYCD